jgi:hypothetical protein
MKIILKKRTLDLDEVYTYLVSGFLYDQPFLGKLIQLI